VLWFDPARAGAPEDKALEAKLRGLDPAVNWSVKNQSRMHIRNNDGPYTSTTEAMRHWPETATAVAVRWTTPTGYEFTAPFGLDDLFALVVRPTPDFRAEKYPQYLNRMQQKAWLANWPLLRAI
jgi:hypothetical protein